MGRVVSNRVETKSTGVSLRDIETQSDVFPISFFGFDVNSDEVPNEYLKKGMDFIKENGTGSIYIPPTKINNYPVYVKYLNRGFTFEIYGRRPPFEEELRPYTEERYKVGDKVINIEPNSEGLMGWVRVAEGSTGWRAWGALRNFYSDAEIVEVFPVPQMEREGQIVYMRGNLPVNDGQVTTFAKKGPYICKQDSEGNWRWEYFITESYGVMEELVRLDSEVKKTQKDLADYSYGLSWKPAVGTFEDIAIEYPNPERNWAVTVADTDITYMYDAEKDEWFPWSLNALPMASLVNDGKMSKEDYAKLLDLTGIGLKNLNLDNNMIDMADVYQLSITNGYKGHLVDLMHEGMEQDNPSGSKSRVLVLDRFDINNITFKETDYQDANEFFREYAYDLFSKVGNRVVTFCTDGDNDDSICPITTSGNERIRVIGKGFDDKVDLWPFKEGLIQNVSVSNLHWEDKVPEKVFIRDVHRISIPSSISSQFILTGNNNVHVEINEGSENVLSLNMEGGSLTLEDGNLSDDTLCKVGGKGDLYIVNHSSSRIVVEGNDVNIKSLLRREELSKYSFVDNEYLSLRVKLTGDGSSVLDGVRFFHFDGSECSEEVERLQGVFEVFPKGDKEYYIGNINCPIHIESYDNQTEDKQSGHLYVIE